MKRLCPKAIPVRYSNPVHCVSWTGISENQQLSGFTVLSDRTPLDNFKGSEFKKKQRFL